MLAQWDDYKREFEFDGSWLDIYVLGTSLPDWQSLLDSLNSGVYEYRYFGGEKDVAPSSVTNIFDTELYCAMEVNIGSIVLNCHFFRYSEIEFDFDPREVTIQIEVEQLFVFMKYLGRLLNKEVILTPESLQSSPIFRFTPGADEVQYIPTKWNY